MNIQKRKKTIVWPFLLAGAIFISGIIYMIYLIFAVVEDFTGSNFRFTAPASEVSVQLETGKYTIYYEFKTYFEDVYFDTGENINGLKLDIKDKIYNEEVTVKNSAVNASYTNSNGSGVSVLDFEIIQPGEYEIISSFVDSEHEKVVLNIGKTMGWSFINSIFGIIGIFMGSIVISVLVAIFGAKWEKKRNSELNV